MIHTHENKRTEIFGKPTDRVALVGHCGAFVFGHVVFGMMHANVVCIISFGRLPEKRANEPGQIMVHKPVFIPEPGPVAGAVHHKAIRAFIGYIIEELIKDSSYPPDKAGNTGPIEYHSKRDKGKSDL